MKNTLITWLSGLILSLFMIALSSCATSNAVSEKAGVSLWSENCNRCHNSPSPNDFTDAQWEKIGSHMKVRANLTDDEIRKIIDFLQSSN